MNRKYHPWWRHKINKSHKRMIAHRGIEKRVVSSLYNKFLIKPSQKSQPAKKDDTSVTDFQTYFTRSLLCSHWMYHAAYDIFHLCILESLKRRKIAENFVFVTFFFGVCLFFHPNGSKKANGKGKQNTKKFSFFSSSFTLVEQIFEIMRWNLLLFLSTEVFFFMARKYKI